MAAIKNYLIDTNELADGLVKRDEVAQQLNISNWGAFVDGLAETLITQGWKAPSQNASEYRK